MALLADDTPALGRGEREDVTLLAGSGGLEVVFLREMAREALNSSLAETEAVDESASGEVGDLREVGPTLVLDLGGNGLTLETDLGEVGVVFCRRELDESLVVD